MLGLIIYIILIYFFVVFVLSRFFVPHLELGSYRMPDKILAEMEKAIKELKNKANSKKEFLELTYDYLGGKYRHERMNTFLKFSYLFKSLDDIWPRQGYVPCTQGSFITEIFLIKSGFFKRDEVRRRCGFVNFCIHQYLQARIEDKWIDIDVGEKQRGMPIDKHLKWFG